MGRAAGPGCPARSGAPRGRSGGCQVIMGRALGGRIPVTWQRILESTDWARASAERQGCAWLARGPRARSRCGVAPGLDREARAGRGVALVIMGRALDAGSPFQDNGFSNRPIGHAPAGSGPGDHGACGRARMPGEVRGQRGGVAGGCWVIMRRALGGRIPVTQQRIPESAAARCSWGVRPTRLGAAGFAGGCRRDAPADHRTCARGPDTRCAATDSRICGGQVLMGRAADSARRGRVRGRVSAGRAS